MTSSLLVRDGCTSKAVSVWMDAQVRLYNIIRTNLEDAAGVDQVFIRGLGAESTID